MPYLIYVLVKRRKKGFCVKNKKDGWKCGINMKTIMMCGKTYLYSVNTKEKALCFYL